jgi:hypothetical protein
MKMMKLSIFLAVTLIAIACRAEEPTSFGEGLIWPEPTTWTYTGSFHKVVSGADRIVIRNGGYDCHGPVDDDEVLLTITNAVQLADFTRMIRFETNQTVDACMCCGYPGVDWFQGTNRLALTGVQHGTGLRWKGFPGDAAFTQESSLALAKWLLKHGIPDLHDQFKKILEEKESPTKPSTATK